MIVNQIALNTNIKPIKGYWSFRNAYKNEIDFVELGYINRKMFPLIFITLK